jgi:hypothetical protein
MARQATGQVVEPDGKQRSWAIRFRAYGKLVGLSAREVRSRRDGAS